MDITTIQVTHYHCSSLSPAARKTICGLRFVWPLLFDLSGMGDPAGSKLPPV